MAVFLDEFVESGVIDNRVRGKITGHLRIKGIEGSVPIDVKGNAQPDLAGCVLTFRNPEAIPIVEELREHCQEPATGEAGLVTASHKGRVYLPTKDPNMEDMEEDFGSENFASLNFMFIEWFRDGIQHFQLRGVHYETEISLPEWQIEESELVEQLERAQMLEAVNKELVREMWEDEAADREFEKLEEKVDMIRPLLKLAASDEARFDIFRKLVSEDYDYAVMVVSEYSDNPDQYNDHAGRPSSNFDDDELPF